MNGKIDSLDVGKMLWVKHEGKFRKVWVFAGDFRKWRNSATYECDGADYTISAADVWTYNPESEPREDGSF